MRKLSVRDTDFEIEDFAAEKLIKDGVLYECGDDHDLHIVPDDRLNLIQVENLLLAISGDKLDA